MKMTFKKMALVAAVAAASSSAVAVDYLDDGDLAGVTGQDGISIAMELNLNATAIIHDTTGLTGVDAVKYLGYTRTFPSDPTDTTDPLYNAMWDPTDPSYDAVAATAAQNADNAAAAGSGYAYAGALVMSGFSLNTNGADIVATIDAGSNGDGTAATNNVLNIGVEIPNGTTLATGDLYIANSQRDNSAWGVTNQGATAVVESMTITLGATELNIQLGNEIQGNGVRTHMVKLDTVMTGGLLIGQVDGVGVAGEGLKVNDVSVGGGQLAVGGIQILDRAGTDLTVRVGVDVEGESAPALDDGALVITLNQLGSGSGIDVRMERVALGQAGTAKYIGDVELQGLTLAGEVRISGK